MPVILKDVLKALREMKIPCTRNQIVQHLQKTTKRKYDMILTEVTEHLAIASCSGIVDFSNGYFFIADAYRSVPTQSELKIFESAVGEESKKKQKLKKVPNKRYLCSLRKSTHDLVKSLTISAAAKKEIYQILDQFIYSKKCSLCSEHNDTKLIDDCMINGNEEVDDEAVSLNLAKPNRTRGEVCGTCERNANITKCKIFNIIDRFAGSPERNICDTSKGNKISSLAKNVTKKSYSRKAAKLSLECGDIESPMKIEVLPECSTSVAQNNKKNSGSLPVEKPSNVAASDKVVELNLVCAHFNSSTKLGVSPESNACAAQEEGKNSNNLLTKNSSKESDTDKVAELNPECAHFELCTKFVDSPECSTSAAQKRKNKNSDSLLVKKQSKKSNSQDKISEPSIESLHAEPSTSHINKNTVKARIYDILDELVKCSKCSTHTICNQPPKTKESAKVFVENDKELPSCSKVTDTISGEAANTMEHFEISPYCNERLRPTWTTKLSKKKMSLQSLENKAAPKNAWNKSWEFCKRSAKAKVFSLITEFLNEYGELDPNYEMTENQITELNDTFDQLNNSAQTSEGDTNSSSTNDLIGHGNLVKEDKPKSIRLREVRKTGGTYGGKRIADSIVGGVEQFSLTKKPKLYSDSYDTHSLEEETDNILEEEQLTEFVNLCTEFEQKYALIEHEIIQISDAIKQLTSSAQISDIVVNSSLTEDSMEQKDLVEKRNPNLICVCKLASTGDKNSGKRIADNVVDVDGVEQLNLTKKRKLNSDSCDIGSDLSQGIHQTETRDEENESVVVDKHG